MTEEITPLEQTNRQKSRALIATTAVFVVITIAFTFLWLFYFRYCKTTDDAYVNGNKINITPAISGTPIAFFVENTDFVKEGDLLVLLDDTAYKLKFEQELANLASTALHLKTLKDQVLSKEIQVTRQEILLSKASYDLNNRQALGQSLAISQEELIHSQEDYRLAKASKELAESELKLAKDALGIFPLNKHPLLEEQKNKVKEAFYHLNHCKIVAPVTGYIAQRSVQLGQFVTPSTYLMALIPEKGMWIEANFKETELASMRIGQPATVTVDLFGSGVKFSGKVKGISSGTGSVFSLIPPQNATGNWIKIVQRLPVRIELDTKEELSYPLRLGLSCEVSVDVSNLKLPSLQKVPSLKQETQTPVFKLDFNELECVMESIIQENMS